MLFSFISLILYLILSYFESKPFIDKLNNLEQLEYKLANKMLDVNMKNIFNMKDQHEMIDRNKINRSIITEGSSFSLVGETGASYIDPSLRRHWDYLKEKLDNGATFKLLIINPFSNSKQFRNKLNKVKQKIDPKLNLNLLFGLNKEYSNIEVRFTNEVYCSLFFSENKMMYDPYHVGMITSRLENYFLAFYLENTEEDFSYFKLLKNHFDNLWDNSTSINDFIKENKSTLKKLHYKFVKN